MKWTQRNWKRRRDIAGAYMGETPIYRAGLDGNLDLLKYLSKNAVEHFHRDSDRISILLDAVVAQHFEWHGVKRFFEDKEEEQLGRAVG
ncbi:hypothetical protein L6164_002912 [Bauhinia variegata]|uniref:Uncharacterized protein n=1 Tax=Bauhinia variegata TaxID=167791 RepID=A0ACB9PZP1_BAUVA|nr:hypothetical protein L6164_002912 [Bauhinia variegata]